MATFRLATIASLILSTSLYTASSHAETDGNVAAVVNGDEISQLMVSYQLRQQASQGQRSSRSEALDQLINLQILRQEAAKQGLDKDAMLQMEIQHQTTVLMANFAVQNHFKNINLSDEDLLKEYEKQVAQIKGSEFKARHILLKGENEAKDVIKELKSGKDFAELAKEKSIGPSSKQGGDLGWFRPQTMVPAFSEAVQKMEKGKYSDAPVQTQFGWHVILLEDVRDIPKPKFEDVKDRIRKIVMNDKLEEYVMGLRKQAKIEKTQPDAAPASDTK